MMGYWSYEWAPKCEDDDIIVGVRTVPVSEQTNSHEKIQAIQAN